MKNQRTVGIAIDYVDRERAMFVDHIGKIVRPFNRWESHEGLLRQIKRSCVGISPSSEEFNATSFSVFNFLEHSRRTVLFDRKIM